MPPAPRVQTHPRALTLACPAKVNLALAVGPADPRRGGYHPIASWMSATDFTDRLTLERLPDQAASTYHIAFAADAPAPQPIDWPTRRDLALRAHQLLEAHTGRSLPIALRLDKRIPAGAGLGGGSADAAGVLVGLDRLFDLALGDRALADLASRLGCDTAFAAAALTRGAAAALVTGLGEMIEWMPLPRPIHLAIVLPPLTCATASVYRRFDQLPAHRPFQRQADRARHLARRGDPLDGGASEVGGAGELTLFNDLEQAAAAAQPRLSALLTLLREDLELPAHLTGSGAAVFVLAATAQAAEDLAQTITRHTALPVVTARSLPPRARGAAPEAADRDASGNPAPPSAPWA